MAVSSLLRIPRPKSFLYFLSLRTGTELITLTLLINKVSGFYGMLALLTGLHLSPLQLSMYMYSILALVITAILAPHIRRQSPLQNVALAWFYLLDSLVNAAYTAAFGFGWFLVLAQHNSPLGGPSSPGANGNAPGGKMMNDAAGFTDPEFNATEVEVVASAVPGNFKIGQDVSLVGHNDASVAATSAAAGALNTTILESGSIFSVVFIALLWLIRFYFIFVVFAYARSVLRQYIVTTSQANFSAPTGGSEKLAENPFALTREEGAGWSGKLGRALISVGKSFWLGADEEGDWARDVGGKFSSRRQGSAASARPFERERRRRAGTGPPENRPPQQPAVELEPTKTVIAK